MLKRVRETTMGSLLTSKLVVVAAVAAVTMVLGAMSVGANWLAQKKLADLVEQQGAPYTSSGGQRSVRHSADNPPVAVASATTEQTQRPSRKRVPVAATPVGQAAAPSTPSAPSSSAVSPALSSAVSGSAASIVSLLVPPVIPPTDSVPGSDAPDTAIQPLQPLQQLLSPVATVLPLEAQIKTPLASIHLGL